MNPRYLFAAVLFLGLGLTYGAEPSITFSGVLTSGDTTYVALTDTATRSTRWVQTGEEFNGYAIARYDATSDAVFLRKGADEIRLPLALAKTVEPTRSAPANPGATTPNATAIAAAVRANLRLLATAGQQLRSRLGVASVSYNDLVGPGKPISSLAPVAGETYSTLNFSPDVTAISVTTSDGATVTLDLQPPITRPATGVESNPPATPVPPGPVTAGTAPTSAPPANTPATTGKQPPPATESQTVAAQPPNVDEKRPATGRQPPSPSYTVQGGDTLQSIAIANGVSLQQLQELNPTLHGSSLRPGETIRIR